MVKYSKTCFALAVSILFCFANLANQKTLQPTLDEVNISAAWADSEIRYSENVSKEFVFDQFYGFVEGRLVLRIPEWWIKQVNQTKMEDRRFRVPLDTSLFEWIDVEQHSLLTDGQVVPSVSDDRLRIRFKGEKFDYEVPNDVVNKTHSIAAKATTDCVYYAFFRQFPSSIFLFCINRENGNLVWKKTVEIYPIERDGGRYGRSSTSTGDCGVSQGCFYFWHNRWFRIYRGAIKKNGYCDI